MKFGRLTISSLILAAYVVISACGTSPETDGEPAETSSDTEDTTSTDTDDSTTSTDSGTDSSTGDEDSSSGDSAADETGDDDSQGGVQIDDPDPRASDPAASITLESGTIDDCLPGFLEGGAMAAYSGFAGSSWGAYFIWKNVWEEEAIANLRIETWDSFGGITSPGTYTIREADTNYADCGVCIFSETAEAGEFWPTVGSTVTFDALKTGEDGIGQIPTRFSLAARSQM